MGVFLDLTKTTIYFLVLSGVLLISYGCGGVHKVGLNYEKIVNARGGSGEIFIAKPLAIFSPPKNPSGQVILGSYWDMVTWELVTEDNIVDWFVNALSQELDFAGYHINTVQELPQNVSKGIRVIVIKVDVTHQTGVRDEFTTNILFNVEIWKNGIKVNDFYVEGVGVYAAFTFRIAKSVATSLNAAMQSSMKEIIPKLIKILEG